MEFNIIVSPSAQLEIEEITDFYFNINSEDTQYYASITIGITRRKGVLLDLSLTYEL